MVLASSPFTLLLPPACFDRSFDELPEQPRSRAHVSRAVFSFFNQVFGYQFGFSKLRPHCETNPRASYV